MAIGDSFDYGEQQDKKLIMPPVKKVDASSPRGNFSQRCSGDLLVQNGFADRAALYLLLVY